MDCRGKASIAGGSRLLREKRNDFTLRNQYIHTQGIHKWMPAKLPARPVPWHLRPISCCLLHDLLWRHSPCNTQKHIVVYILIIFISRYLGDISRHGIEKMAAQEVWQFQNWTCVVKYHAGLESLTRIVISRHHLKFADLNRYKVSFMNPEH